MSCITNLHSADSYFRDHPSTAASTQQLLDRDILLLLAQNGFGAEASACLNLCRDTRNNVELWRWTIDVPKGEEQTTRLMHWSEQGNAALVAWHLGRGARPDARDKHGSTPLMYACGSIHVEGIESKRKADVISLLLTGGADITAADYDGWTALHDAAWAGSVPAVKAILDAVHEASLVRATAPTRTSVAATSAVTAHAALLNARDSEGYTALHLAASGGHRDVVAVLLNAGADLCANVAPNQFTVRSLNVPPAPLALAEYTGHNDVAQMLRDAMAELTGSRNT